jgi:hypothetical protein
VTVVLPLPVPLADPPGSSAALGAVVDQLAGAGFAAGLTVHLLEPAAVLTGWQGADATVAAAEVGTASAVAADLHEALTAARSRLVDHHELWLVVLARLTELRADQRAQFAAAGARLAVLIGTTAESGAPDAPEASALVARLAEDDAARGAEHRALLSALAEDAAGAATLLAAGTRPFGGTGRGADAVAVTVRLAVQLPGWGAGALAGLGVAAADDLTRPGTAEQLAGAVAHWGRWASLPGFGDALVGRLGSDGVRWLLSVLAGQAGTGEEEPLAALLAGVLGGSRSGDDGRVAEVLAQVRLDPDDPGDAVDVLAVGMALVLAEPGIGPGLAASWGGQALAREAARGMRAGAAATGAARLPDPVDAAVAVLARAGDRAAAAQLLEEASAWTTLLSRSWPGGTDDLAAVIQLAAAAPTGGQAARSALLALGQGIAPGSGGRVLDDELVLSRVRGAVTALVAGQSDVVLPVLDAAARGTELDAVTDRALRGLAHLVSDAESATQVTAAVRAALRAGEAGAFAAQIAGAHVAVLEYGQRLHYALEWSRAQSAAVDAQMLWTLAVTLPVSLVPGPAGELAGGVEGVLADVLDANGDVEIGPDSGAARTDTDAARFAVQTLGPTVEPGGAPVSDAAARIGFHRAADLLGRLQPPEETWLDRLGDLPVPDLGRGARHGR